MRLSHVTTTASAAAAALLLLAPYDAVAATWTQAGGTDDFTGFVDVDSVKSSGQVATAWVRIDYNKAAAQRSDVDQIKAMYEVTCGQNKLRALASSSYKRGKLVSSSETPYSAQSAVRPDSFGEHIYDAVCAFKELGPAFSEWLKKNPQEAVK